MVQQIRAVAAHPHVLQGDHQPALVGLREELVAAPLRDDFGDGLSILFVVNTLLRRHRHEEVLVEPFGQLFQDLRLPAADQHRRQRLADAVEVSIADDLAVVVVHLMIRQESEGRPEPMLVDKRDD